ncbi:MAG: hypothetical protein ACYC3X_11240 [Pirellulaceae bacterium]
MRSVTGASASSWQTLCDVTRHRLVRPAHLVYLVAIGIALSAGPPRLHAAEEPSKEQPERVIFVPFDALSGILGGENERVFMTREEFRALEAEARKQPPSKAPQPVVLLSASYEGTIRESMAVLRGQLELEVLDPGLHSVPLSLEGVALRTALLDGATAPISRNAQGQVVLFVREAGRHRLDLEFQAPVVIAAAQQSLQLRLPVAGSSRLQVIVPGNVEVKSGAQVVQRQYEEASDQTRFELLFQDGAIAVVMSLNNRRLREDRVVLSRAVLVSELTTSYERLHATVEMNVLHGAVDRFLFDVPVGFQITSVASPLLSQWIIRQEAEREVLEINLREPTRGHETLNIAATRAPVVIGQWSMPTLKPRDVAGQVSVIGVLAEARLRPLQVVADNLIRIDTSALRSALPESVLQAEPGAPEIRPIAAFYGPGDAFALSAAFEDPRDELRVAAHLLLSLGAEQQTLRGGFTFTPQAAKQTAFAFRMPSEWQLQKVYGADQQALTYQRYPLEKETRYVVTLPTAIEPGTTVTIYFEASYRSSAWLGDWTSLDVEFPRIAVEQATDATGAIAVQPTGDLTAKPLTIEGLTPLDANQRGRFGLAESANELTYQVTADMYRAVFRVERTQPRISTRNYSFFEIRDGLLVAHYEVVYIIDRAHTNRLELELPATTPTTLSIRGLNGIQLKESSQVTQDGKRIWTALLASDQTGTVGLAIDFEQRIEDTGTGNVSLPVIRATNVAYQTQMVSVESGDPTLDVDIVQTTMRGVDVGELAEAEYTPGRPGRQLLGAFASTADDASIQATVARRDLHPLPAAIVECAELVTLVSTTGVSQSAARYLLQTKLPFLAIRFPADAELWSVSLNDKPIKPRRRGDQIVLSLQAEEAGIRRDLQVVYQAPVAGVSWVGQIRMQAPQLWLMQDEQDAGLPVPQVDLVWHVYLPTGYRLSRVEGTVFTNELPPVASPWRGLAQAGTTIGGGVVGPPFMMAASRAARDMAVAAGTKSAESRRTRFRRDNSLARGEANSPDVYHDDVMYDAKSSEMSRPGTPPTSSFAVRDQTWDYASAAPESAPAPPANGEPTQSLAESRTDESTAAGVQSSSMMPGMGGMGGAGGTTDSDGMMGAGGMPGSGSGMGMAGPGAGAPAQPPTNANTNGNVNLWSASRPAATTAEAAGQTPQAAGGPQLSLDSQGGSQTAADFEGHNVEGARVADDRLPVLLPAKPAEPGADSGSAGASKLAKYWALQGLRGLSIEIDQSQVGSTTSRPGAETNAALTFRSLGNDPELDITVYQQHRMTWLAWAVALFIVVVGLLRAHAPLRTRVRWVVLSALLACGLPIIGGPLTEFAVVFEKALLAIFALVPLWIVIACVERCAGWFRRPAAHVAAVRATAGVLIALAMFTSLAAPATAQDLRELLQPILDQDKPVKIPEDAVVVPYDPADIEQRDSATKVLVPYARYVELWNLAHPDQKIGDPVAAEKFSFAGASYEVILEDAEHIVLRGSLDMELFTNDPLDVPLALQDGVITSALLDGKPARLKAVQPAPVAQQPQAAPAEQAQVANPAPPAATPIPPSLLTLLVEGQGRHRLELDIRVAVVRQGGSRLASATIPYAEATAVKVTVPEAETNVRRNVGGTALSETTTQNQQTMDATLSERGRFEVTWRARITPGSVDQALTTTSLALVDVREDGLHVTWRLDFSFGQTDRSTFRLEVPRDFLVELVEGKNVRGWDLATESEQSFLTVELLKAVKQSEQLTVHLSRRMAFSPGEPTNVAVPFVAVPEAALHRGTVQIRRSTILELQTSEDRGVTRTDGANVAEQLAAADGGFGSPLSVRDYQAYKFAATPFQVGLVVAQIQPRITAEVRTLFRLGETEAALESEIQILAQHRSVYQVRIDIPEDLELEQVAAAGLSDWSISATAGQRTLTAFFAAGQVDRFSISLRGKLHDHLADAAVPLPQIAVRDLDQQQGTLVIQVDSSLDARTAALEGCGPILLDRVKSWVTDAQLPLARLALEYQGAAYRGNIALSPRTPRVTCVTVSNVRVTFREIQETILLDFQIAEAGIRQIVFRLPASLKDAHISAPRIREQSVVPVEGSDYVRVTLNLQDAITGDYRVVVENDRAIAPDQQLAPLPLVDLGTTKHRYVTLENAGRDEVLVDEAPGMEPVTRASRQWEQLAALLQGGDFTTAYVTAQTGAEVSFRYRMKQREIVKTADASIGLARTELVLDASGAYRASMLLKVDNRTEPFLQIELPPGATLWTAHVASQPVKPAQATGTENPQVLRIPLIKTAEGDLDFPVVLKYAGKFDRLRTFQTVSIPVIRTDNINIEMSQVQLHLPPDFEWFHFTGTATRAQDEDDFKAGYVAYRTQQVEKLTQIIRGSNEFSKARAVVNVKALEQELQGLQRDGRLSSSNVQLRSNLDSNALVVQAATEEIEQLKTQTVAGTDNRERLNGYFFEQGNTLSRNEAIRLGTNFAAPTETAAPAESAERFDQEWFKLGDLKKDQLEAVAGKALAADESKAKQRIVKSEKSGRAQQKMDAPAADDAAQQVFQTQSPEPGGQPAGNQPADGKPQQNQLGQQARYGTKEALNRAYADKIERQVAQDDFAALRVPSSGEIPQSQLGDGVSQTTANLEGQEAAFGRAGFASLDFQLPQRGSEFFFTTPRSNVEISVRPIESRLLEQLGSFVAMVALVALVLVGWWLLRKLAFNRRGRLIAAMLLCGAGVMCIVLGVLPIYGIVMILGGVLLALGERRPQESRAAA